MRCPYCQNPLSATTPECPSCHLSLSRANTLLGVIPRLSPTVADTTGSLHSSDQKKISRRIAALQRKFPQVIVQVVMHQFPAQHPFSLYTFWLFNSAVFAGDMRRGADNYSLLILIDPKRRETAIMPGYGLEPLLPAGSLASLLKQACDSWERSSWEEGILLLLDGFDSLLTDISLPAPLEQELTEF